MTNYKKSAFLFLQRFILIVLIYQFSRLLFYFINIELFDRFTLQNFVGGLLFDLAAISYINIPFLIAHLIPGNFKYNNLYQKILKITFYVVNLIFISTNFIDIIYYRFTGRRSTFGMITAKGMKQEIPGLLPSFLREFWYIGIIFLILSFLLWKLIPSLNDTVILKKIDIYLFFNYYNCYYWPWRFTKKTYKNC